MKIVKVDNDRVLELQRLSVEVESRKDLISFMLSRGMDITTGQFDKYQKEYTQLYGEYESKKMELERDYVRTAVKNPKSWNLDFNSGELTIEE